MRAPRCNANTQNNQVESHNERVGVVVVGCWLILARANRNVYGLGSPENGRCGTAQTQQPFNSLARLSPNGTQKRQFWRMHRNHLAIHLVGWLLVSIFIGTRRSRTNPAGSSFYLMMFYLHLLSRSRLEHSCNSWNEGNQVIIRKCQLIFGVIVPVRNGSNEPSPQLFTEKRHLHVRYIITSFEKNTKNRKI